MPANVYDCVAGSTKELRFVNSGAIAGSISCALLDRNETLITSVAATSSGNGFYYALLVHPGSTCWVVNEWKAVFGANSYTMRQFGRVIAMEVD